MVESKLPNKVLGKRLKQIRGVMGYTQAQMAAQVPCDSLTLSRIERGENLMAEKVVAVLAFLSRKVNINYLLSENFDITNEEALFHMGYEFNSVAKAKLDFIKEDLHEIIDKINAAQEYIK